MIADPEETHPKGFYVWCHCDKLTLAKLRSNYFHSCLFLLLLLLLYFSSFCNLSEMSASLLLLDCAARNGEFSWYKFEDIWEKKKANDLRLHLPHNPAGFHRSAVLMSKCCLTESPRLRLLTMTKDKVVKMKRYRQREKRWTERLTVCRWIINQPVELCSIWSDLLIGHFISEGGGQSPVTERWPITAGGQLIMAFILHCKPALFFFRNRCLFSFPSQERNEIITWNVMRWFLLRNKRNHGRSRLYHAKVSNLTADLEKQILKNWNKVANMPF